MPKPGSSDARGVTRRGFLASAAAVAALPRLPARREPPAQAVIQVLLQGGLSHLDTFDPKPSAPIDYRGELGTVKSKLDGEPLSEVLARTAAVADRLTLLRAMTHTEAAHERGTHSMLTGFQPSPAITYPAMGAVVAQQLGSRNDLPPYVCIPSASEPFLGTGYLSAAAAPFSPGGDPNAKDWRVRDLVPPQGLDAERSARRRRLLAAIDRGFACRSDALDATQEFYAQAWRLIDSEPARAAFEIGAEPEPVRERYGRTPLGQRFLLARRLVQAGVRWVTVLDGGYDHHERIFPGLRERLRPFDHGFAALLADLDERGLLASTLVLVQSEFGRTPRVNKDGGRDHWPRVFTVVIAGGGVKRGCVHGASSDTGSEPERDPVTPADLAATVFTQLGLDPAQKLLSPGNRPIDVVRDGQPIAAILG